MQDTTTEDKNLLSLCTNPMSTPQPTKTKIESNRGKKTISQATASPVEIDPISNNLKDED
jgi:hypothetical protein